MTLDSIMCPTHYNSFNRSNQQLLKYDKLLNKVLHKSQAKSIELISYINRGSTAAMAPDNRFRLLHTTLRGKKDLVT